MSLFYLSDWRPEDGVPYVLRKRGYFYRHNNKGYTASVFEAELFSESRAKDYEELSHGETKAMPVTDFLPGSYEAFREFLDRIHVLHDVVAEREGWPS